MNFFKNLCSNTITECLPFLSSPSAQSHVPVPDQASNVLIEEENEKRNQFENKSLNLNKVVFMQGYKNEATCGIRKQRQSSKL